LKLYFQWVVIHPDRTPNKRVTPFLLCWCKLSQADFRSVTPKDLVVTSCTGLLKCWFLMHWKVDLMEHLNIQFVSFLYIYEHVLNLDENSSAPFGILEVLMILISAFITNSWEWFTMPAK
jgi:hypothetical protein